MRLRRCELSTPGSNEKMIEKALGSNADVVFLDLEDAVAPNQKVEARGKVIKALKTLDWGRKTRAVRMNNIETEYAYQDVIEVAENAGEQLDVIIIPKVKAARDIFWVDTLLTQIETRLKRKHKIALECLIEEVEALINVEEIAKSSRRLEAIIFGPGDFSASQGVRMGKTIGGSITTYPGDIWHYARSKIVVAARAAGIEAIDGPYADFKNPAGYREEAIRSATMGFAGKWAIHPSQIELANEMFSPSQEEIDRARQLEAAYAKAEAEGLGAVTFDGVMIDAASVRIIRNVIDKANLIGL
ncbi:MAG TPA: CoA ester lyase [Candidatus Binataceae bacterium]|nr:CoA ester lyase [Candidatus Binataceae bacterium]